MLVETRRIKAFTTHQPWASLLALGAKTDETRPHGITYRGPIAIHASKKRAAYEGRREREFYLRLAEAFGFEIEKTLTQLRHLPHGAIVGVAELYDSNEILESTWKEITRVELVFGNWTPGRYRWRLRNPRKLDEPIPMRGQLGLWNVTLPAEVVHV